MKRNADTTQCWEHEKGCFSFSFISIYLHTKFSSLSNTSGTTITTTKKNALEWPFMKAEQINQTSELSEMTGYKLMKILFLYRSMKNTILNGISEEKGRCCWSAVYNRQYIDKDFLWLSSLNIHPFISDVYHVKLRLHILAPTVKLWHSWGCKKQLCFLSPILSFTLLHNNVPKSGCIF